MNRKLHALLCLLIVSGAAASAASLQFTNISSVVFSNGQSNSLLSAVAYGGSSNFVAVGEDGTSVRGLFRPNQNFLTNANWNTSSVGTNLLGITSSSNGLFLACGANAGINNVVFRSTDGVIWTTNGPTFVNAARADALAYNNGTFAIVCAAPQMAWATNSTNSPWTNANLANLSFLESYRAVTPFGANGFAACGVFGVVRLSTDGARNWTNVFGQVGQPDLFGIASAGANLVAVGSTPNSTNGMIIVSTNNGANWITNYANTNTSTRLNAAARLNGAGFIAVGKGGQILTSSNGLAWTNVASPTANDLRGAVFATSGFMQGVGMLVGANGTVILAAEPPSAPANPVGATNCATFPLAANNNPVRVEVVPDTNHLAGTVTVDWYDAPTGGNLITFGTNVSGLVYSLTLTNNPDLVGSNSPVFYTNYAGARDLRTGFVSTNRTPVVLRINPRPTSTLTTLDTTICNIGTPYTLTNILTGLGPWTVTWLSNSQAVVQDNLGGTVPGPYTNLLVVTPTNTFANSAYTNIYFVQSVSNNATTCTGNQSGDITGTNTVVINPRPTSVLTSFATTNCNIGAPYTLTNILTGLGPWTVIWSSNGVPVEQGISSSAPGPFTNTFAVVPKNTFANSAFTNIYFVQSVSNNATTCSGNIPGEVTGLVSVMINPRPTSVLTSFATTNCNIGTPYTLTNILTGLGPWTVVWSSNSMEVAQVVTNVAPGPFTNTFPVVPTTTNANGAFTNVYFVKAVTNDATVCGGNQPGEVTGLVSVRINPRPTSVLTSFATTNCNIGTIYTLTNILTGLGPWTVVWSSNSMEVAQVVTNVAPGPFTNTFPVVPTTTNANAAFTNVYFVKAVTNDATVCGGNQPGEVTGLVSVRINPRPTSVLTSFATTNCNIGTIYTLTNILTGLGPWTVVWSSNSMEVAQVVTNVAPGPFTNTFPVVPTTTNANAAFTNVYFVKAVTNDATVCGGNQPGEVTGLVSVRINPLQKSTMLSAPNIAICNGDTIYLTNKLEGLGPWFMTWSDGFKQTNNALVGPITNVYTLALTNALYPNNTNSATNILVTYSITSLVTSNSCVGSSSGATVVDIRPRAIATVSGSDSFCVSGLANIQVALTGIGPWNFNLFTNGVFMGSNTVPATSSLPAITNLLVSFTNNSLSTTLTNIFTVANLVDQGLTNAGWDCSPLYVSNAVVKVYPLLSAIVTPEDITIPTNGSQIISVALTGSKPWTLMWDDGTNQIGSNSPVTRVIYGTNIGGIGASRTFTLTNVTDNGSPCPTALTTNNSATIGLAGTDLIAKIEGGLKVTNTICAGECRNISVSLTNWTSGPKTYGSPWFVTFSDGNTTTNTSTNNSATFTYTVCPSTNTVITITGVRGTNDKKTNPLSSSLFGGSSTILVNPRPTANVTSANRLVCLGDSVSIGLLLTGKSPWTVSMSDGTSQMFATNNAVYVVAPISNFTYSVTSLTDSNLCNGTNLTGSVVVAVTNCTPLTILVDTNSIPPTNVVLEWGGNRWLQSNSSLVLPPWKNILQGGLPGTTNFLTNPIAGDQLFYRLAAPTNGP